MPIGVTWHTALDVPTADPFSARIEEVGVPIVLSADGREAELRLELFATIEAENKLAADGDECRIKTGDGVSCFACPLYDPVDELCNLGRQQQTILTELRVLHLGGRRQ